MKRIFVSLFFLFFVSRVWGDYVVIENRQMVEETDERKARSEAIDKATNAVTIQMVIREIGLDRYNENKEKVSAQVKSLKNRFIPFFKILSSQKTPEGFEFNIEVKVSRQDLRQVLQQKGLFASNEKTGITLPFIEFNNNLSGESYRWWSPVFTTSNELTSLALVFERQMFQGFLDRGLFLLRPQAFHMVHMIPDYLRKTYMTQTEMVQLTHLKKGQLYLDGRVDILNSPLRENAYRVRVQVSCKQASNGKSLAEVVRTFDGAAGEQVNQLVSKVSEMASEVGSEIGEQVYDLWQRGALEAQVLQLAVTGDLDHQDLYRLKKALADSIGARNGLTERLFEPGRVTFEMDYRGGVEALSQKLRTTRIKGFISQVVSSNADQVILDVRVAQ